MHDRRRREAHSAVALGGGTSPRPQRGDARTPPMRAPSALPHECAIHCVDADDCILMIRVCAPRTAGVGLGAELPIVSELRLAA
jgi:hypothetical protein